MVLGKLKIGFEGVLGLEKNGVLVRFGIEKIWGLGKLGESVGDMVFFIYRLLE